jgi:4-nitrophenyl phosphatase
MQSLSEMQAAIVDMDGVLWQGDQPLPGLVEFFSTLRERQVRLVLATNNASQTAEQYVARLAGMGVDVTRDEVLTSAQAAAFYVRAQLPGGSNGRGPARARVFAIGEDGLRQALTEQGLALCDLYDVTADYVVCGIDRGLSWDKLATATLNIRAGAKFIGTNPDTTLPTERGITHGNGAILAALHAATGVPPIIIGKPQPIMYQQALQRLQSDPAVTVGIGDRLDTDILGAIRAGLPSVLVLSGISTPADLAQLDYAPTWVLPDIRAITRALKDSDVPRRHVLRGH